MDLPILPISRASPLDLRGDRRARSPQKNSGNNPELTEEQIACFFEDEHAGKFLFNATLGKWLRYEKVWHPDTTGTVFEAIRKMVRNLPPQWQKASVVRNVEFLNRSASRFAALHTDFDRDPMLLGTPDCTIDLSTGRSLSSHQSNRISKMTAVSPAAGSPKRWLQFLAEATGDDTDLIRFLQQLAGYALTGDTSEQCLFFMYGDGGTGKSTFANILNDLLGTYASQAAMDTFVAGNFDKHPTDLAMLAGARLVTANETEQGRQWATARIKSLSGSDPVTARFMRMDFFTYQPTFKLLFVGNFAPGLEVVDEAMRRRFHVIPFDIKPKVKDERLREKLIAELPQILSWCIEGTLDWHANGLVVPEKVKQATGIYFEEQDLFSQWLAEKVDRSDYKAQTSKTKALARWNAYRHAAGERPESTRALNQRLVRRGFKEGRSSDHSNRERVWFGMELHDEA